MTEEATASAGTAPAINETQMDVRQEQLPNTRAELESKIQQIEQEMMAAGREWDFALAREKEAELEARTQQRAQLLTVSELRAEMETMHERINKCIEARQWDEAESIKEAISQLEHRLSVETFDGGAESVGSNLRQKRKLLQSNTSEPYDDVGTRHDFLTVFQAEPLVWLDMKDNIHPFGRPPDFPGERNTLLEAVKDADKVGKKIHVDFQIATTNRLAASLATGQSRVLHVSCHGDQEYLAIENGWGAMQVLFFPELEEFIAAGSGHLKLVFVSSCFSHDAGKAFVDAGVPHVVCCKQDESLKDAAAVEFSRHIYRNLACGRRLRKAFEMAEAALKVAPLESQKFLLLPEKPHDDPYHDVKVFYEDATTVPDVRFGRSTSLVPGRILPPPPKIFLGRQVVMYEVLRDIRSSRFIQITGPQGIGKSSLGQAVCRYVDDRKDEFFFEDVVWFPALGNSSDNDDLSVGFHEVLESVSNDGASESLDASSYKKSCGNIVSLLYERRCLIFLDASRGIMNSDSAMTKLQTFLEILLRGTMHASVILICPSGKYISSTRISDDKRVHLAPLDMCTTVALFATKCSFVKQGPFDFASGLVPVVQKDATVINKSMSKRCSDIFSIVGEGYPEKIISSAEKMTREEYDNLIAIGSRQEFQTKIDTRVALDREVSRLSNILGSLEEKRDLLKAQEIKDTMDELEVLRESLPSVASLRVKEADLCETLDKLVYSKEFAKANKLQNEVDRLRMRIQREEEVMLKATKPKSPEQSSLTHVERYRICHDSNGDDRAFNLHVSHGSITDFSYEGGRSAIVCATDESCKPVPGGVAGRVAQAGGVQFREDLSKLPSVKKNPLGDVKCPTGEARIIGPRSYGTLHVPFVIMAAGPTYLDTSDDDSDLLSVQGKKDALLRSAYQSALELARKERLVSVGFSLVSAGNRSGVHFERTLLVALEAVCGFEGYSELQEIHLCAFEQYQCEGLMKLCGELGLGTVPTAKSVALASQRISQLSTRSTPRKLFGWWGWKNHDDQKSVPSSPSESIIGTFPISSEHGDRRTFELVAVQGSIVDFSYPNRHGAIVCPTNEGCTPVEGSVDGAICQVGGTEFLAKVSKLPTLEGNAQEGVRCRTGEARIVGPATQSYGKLQVPYVIFAVGPTYTVGDDRERREENDRLLRSAYESSLDLAKEAHLETVAFSLISAGYRAAGDVARVLRIAVETISEYTGYDELKQIRLYAFKKQEADTLNTILCDKGLQSSDDKISVES